VRKPIVFVGIGRGTRRRALTRTHMAELMCISENEFHELFDWDNLYGEETVPTDVQRAEERIEDQQRVPSLLRRLRQHERPIVLGERVAEALGCDHEPLFEWFALDSSSSLVFARVKHTTDRLWNRYEQGRGDYWAEMREFLKAEVLPLARQ
jgi:hypothetical protein